MSIPKTIHLCWFGGNPFPPKIERCLKSIRKLTQLGYEIRLWDESSYDVTASERVKKAYDQKQWALVSDYARLDILRKFGGIYMDTDIELVRPLDELLEHELFIGFMWDCNLGTAVLGARPEHPIIVDLLRKYDEADDWSGMLPNNDLYTRYFLEHVPSFRLSGKTQELGGVLVVEKYVFEHPSLFRRSNYTVHHFEQSWHAKSSLKAYAKVIIIKTCSLWLYRKYVCWNSRRISPFYGIFLDTLQQEARP